MKYTHKKIVCGPAGIGCNCCRKASTVKGARVMLNRRARRIGKLTIANE